MRKHGVRMRLCSLVKDIRFEHFSIFDRLLRVLASDGKVMVFVVQRLPWRLLYWMILDRPAKSGA